MCTVTFVPRETGYYLAMNRDEKLTRIAGLPPERKIVAGCAVLCPSEPGSGTWISVNDAGVSFALINWYSVSARVNTDVVSRGTVVEAVKAMTSLEVVDGAMAELPLDRINPFRVIGFFPSNRSITEWRWDLKTLVREAHCWKVQQWISSGFDEPGAQRSRSRVFLQAQRQKSAGTLDWLRRLHRSHSPESGPYSTCMHRADAATVSYSEVRVSLRKIRVRYSAGPPCRKSGYMSFDI